MMTDVSIYDVKTGTVTYRDFTAAEIAQRETDAKADKQRDKEKTAENNNRNAAIAHAKTLGFTDAMLAVMYPNLIASE
jgi:hypothetical protein